MSVKLVITHVSSGQKFEGDWLNGSKEEAVAAITDALCDATTITVGAAIMPCEFVRNHCVIHVQDVHR